MNVRKLMTVVLLCCLGVSFDVSSQNKCSDDCYNSKCDSPKPYNPNRLIIKHGLQLPCWIGTDDVHGSDKFAAYRINPSDWKIANFTGPTFFVKPLFNPTFFESFPNSQWSIAKAPFGDELMSESSQPTLENYQNGFLSKQQLEKLETLTSICFGDEEYYNGSECSWNKQAYVGSELVQLLKKWYYISRLYYPDVMVHNNQYPGQWKDEYYEDYIKETKPDMLTFDFYYYHHRDWDRHNLLSRMVRHFLPHRKRALDGWTRDGKNYMVYGQYVQGFVNSMDNTGTKLWTITESELRSYYGITWTFGGKWLNWFRYLQGNDLENGKSADSSLCLLLENGQPGHPTMQRHMGWVNACNKESKLIGDYLVRLKSTEIRFVEGDSACTQTIPDANSKLDFYKFEKNIAHLPIKDIYSSVVGRDNAKGDLYMGFFSVIPKEENGDPYFFKNKNADYFMVANMYLSDEITVSAKSLSQNIVIGLEQGKKLTWFNPETLKKETLKPYKKENSLTYFKVKIWGGTSALFIAE